MCENPLHIVKKLAIIIHKLVDQLGPVKLIVPLTSKKHQFHYFSTDWARPIITTSQPKILLKYQFALSIEFLSIKLAGQ